MFLLVEDEDGSLNGSSDVSFDDSLMSNASPFDLAATKPTI